MLYRTQLRKRALDGRDGEVGAITDAYFDDVKWTVRYLVVDTGTWLAGRKVLISPASLAAEQSADGPLRARLTRRQIEAGPGVDTDRPVSRQYEAAHAVYYGYPAYWSGPDLWGAGAFPLSDTLAQVERDLQASDEPRRQQVHDDPHLRSCAEVTGYRIEAIDGAIGRLTDFVIDPWSWQICHLLVDTRNWLPGKKVALDPPAIQQVSWPERRVRIGRPRAEIEAAPEFRG